MNASVGEHTPGAPIEPAHLRRRLEELIACHGVPGASVAVVDPELVSDTATYVNPTSPAVGIRHLIVAGTPVVRNGDLLPDAFPGQPLRAEPAAV